MVCKTLHRGDPKLNIAKPGKNLLCTKLYSPLKKTLQSDGRLWTWLWPLLAFAILFFLAGIGNIASLMHYNSADYSGEQNISSSFLHLALLKLFEMFTLTLPDTQFQVDKMIGNYYTLDLILMV